MSETVSVKHSYQCVRSISRRSGSNFYRSFSLLPRRKRNGMCALYAFARITDDLGDCDQPVTIRTRWLEWWRQTIALNLADSVPANEVVFAAQMPELENQWDIDVPRFALQIVPALRDAQRSFQIPTRHFLEITDGVLADQQKTRFDTYEQLEHYCYLVASAIGLACLYVWEFSELPEKAAIDCGLAFQLTNILRDISEDAARGRIYLPRQHYEAHGLCEDDLLQPRPDDRLRCLIEDEIARAKELYNSGWMIWDSLSDDGKPMFSMMWRTYRRLLDHIAADPRSVAVRRVRLSRGEKFGLIARHFIPPLFHRLPVPPRELSVS